MTLACAKIRKKIKTPPKIDGTTEKTQKSPLILKDFFERKIVDNEKSITEREKGDKDGLTNTYEVNMNMRRINKLQGSASV